MADDSGIEVDALGGKPGPRSARYAGEHATDEENLQLLMRALKGIPGAGRTARYRCVAALAFPDGRELHADGLCEGTLVTRRRGERGFGYDPIFVPGGVGGDHGRAHRRAEGPHQPSRTGIPRPCGAPRPTRLKVGPSPADAPCVSKRVLASTPIDACCEPPAASSRAGRRALVVVLGLSFIGVVGGPGLPDGSQPLAVAAVPHADRPRDVEPGPALGRGDGRRGDRGGHRVRRALRPDGGRRRVCFRTGTRSCASPCSLRSRCSSTPCGRSSTINGRAWRSRPSVPATSAS